MPFWQLMTDSPQIGLSSFGGISSVILDERVFVVFLVLKTRTSPSPCVQFHTFIWWETLCLLVFFHLPPSPS